ncbi:Uncharacterised protein (plasmid) [Tsukamurella tyrosinosolvens]|uniref:Uncharacterized protein n=1 Tax=Tsukamurella tyrosinosolvens TaxID=57704 RepID=A0A1H4V2F4_TSUTY|nr:hypothetical protein [Tsukamurella tyrosinosolvens]KXO91068.1 hypothetical protein AXK58_21800 [Tsukamurella tyrosinosolvens]SEC75262.1 hypothetical protein SAMN04489793_3121 [Tsukamurella tyrosinosolvens]VEH90722.1 Uncharacterised protein [Tsukamurella tyrosinosolvens]
MSRWYLSASVHGDLAELAEASRHPGLTWIAGDGDTALIAVTFEFDSDRAASALDAGMSELTHRLGAAATTITASALVREDDDVIFDPDNL